MQITKAQARARQNQMARLMSSGFVQREAEQEMTKLLQLEIAKAQRIVARRIARSNHRRNWAIRNNSVSKTGSSAGRHYFRQADLANSGFPRRALIPA